MPDSLEKVACKAVPPDPKGFNPKAKIPYGCTVEHFQSAMKEFTDFLAFINQQLLTKKLLRLETMMMSANFSSFVGEFMTTSIPKYNSQIVKNQYHNGHPDLIPKGKFSRDAIQYTNEGIEVKASRYLKGWQGHNPENVWLMVFVFECNRTGDKINKVPSMPFRFLLVAGALLSKKDWLFAGRSATSRRTITASVTASGYKKMMANWIYREPSLDDLIRA